MQKRSSTGPVLLFVSIAGLLLAIVLGCRIEGIVLMPDLVIEIDGSPYASGDTVSFGTLPRSSSTDVTVNVRNDGEGLLEIGAVEPVGHSGHPGTGHEAQITVEVPFEVVDPGDTRSFVMSILPTTAVATENYAALRIPSNDVDEGDYRVNIEFVTGS